MSLEQVKSGILSLTDKEISEVISTINFRRKELNQQVKRQFGIGDRVWFNGRNGVKVEGKITKINRKNIVVKEDEGWIQWSVSPSLLREVSGV